MNRPSVTVVIVNYNGWAHTIECLESVLRMDYEEFHTVVVDNGSTDDSLAKIRQWASGEMAFVPQTGASYVNQLTTPPMTKPVPVREMNWARRPQAFAHEVKGSLALIDRGSANRGFAAGANIGIQFAIEYGRSPFVWLLTNDIVVERDALKRLVEKASMDSSIGICGSTVRLYHAPDTVQLVGGATYNKWFSLVRPVGAGLSWSKDGVQSFPSDVEIDYISGASMLVRRDLIHSVGLVSEDYYLYCEELDWAYRAKGRFKLAFEPSSVVFHKHGATIGSSRSHRTRGALSDYYGARSRIIFTKKFFPFAVPTVVMVILATIARRILYGRFRNASAIWRAVTGAPPSR